MSAEAPNEVTSALNYIQKVLELTNENLSSRVKNHPAAHTIEEWRPFASSFENCRMCKNLFLAPKKKDKLFLVVALEDTNIDMKKLTKYLGYSSGTLRFSTEETLFQTLGVKQGAVTPIGLMNDKQATVTVLIDHLMAQTEKNDPPQAMLFHPLSNEWTVKLTFSELEKFAKSTNHELTLLDFSSI
mmetsp:Transcript_25786/g.36258  ORF Transcript_25786/g.36258 Transcript_25786/m.36258 type:complete len:186 (+) Transcript_25786:160-717(+)